MKSRCFICRSRIDEGNDSKEHIIPAAIGGRKTISGFVCRKCNSETGRTWDADLSQQLNSLTVYLRVKRQSKRLSKHQFATTDGKKVNLYSDGKMYDAEPRIDIKETSSGVAIELSSRNKEELARILKGLSKKFPNLDPDMAMKD